MKKIAMRKKIKILLTLFLWTIAWGLSAQTIRVKGKVTGTDKLPVPGAVVSLTGVDRSVQTNESGEFEIEAINPEGTITISADGFYEMSQPLRKRTQIEVVLIPAGKSKSDEVVVLPFRSGNTTEKTTSAVNITKSGLGTGLNIESALQGEIPGLRVVNKSGMPGEGAYLNLRGIRTLISDNAPLIVVNGIPYMPDKNDSPVIGGYSRGLLNAFDLNDIQNVTVLKGAEAALYGSMGSNGVILIETDGTGSDDLETRITYSGQFGMNWNKKELPVLGVDDYKAYVSDVGMTYYSDMQDLLDDYPFLKDDPDYYYNYLYNNNTNWQQAVYSPGLVTDNVLRVEGGDAVAKYDISLGYINNEGVVDQTKQNRYHTQINTNVMINRKLELFTTVGLAYMQGKFQEQGMIRETNPVLVAYNKSPLLSPYKKDADGGILDEYDVYRYGVSNPVAIVNTMVAENKLYDVNLRLGLNYRPDENLLLSGIFGLYYNYNQENVFIPGVTDVAIVPLNNDLAENTVRDGIGETRNNYYNLNGCYNKIFNDIHAVSFSAGAQFLISKKEYDAGSGYNTANDYYQTLDYVESGSESFYGYIDEWKWMNFYAHGDYTWKSLIRTSFNLGVDGTSSSGADADRFGIFPGAGITFMSKNVKGLVNSSFLNKMDLRAEYGLTGNSRFSSNYGKNYYHSAQFQMLSGIVRSNIPNTRLKWEETRQLDLGTDLSLFRYRLDLSFNYYHAKSNDVLFAQPVSSVYGTSSYYGNTAKTDNEGVEISLSAALIRRKNLEWTIGGNLGTAKSKVVSLGDVKESITTFDDGAQVITRVGEKPYCFYGYVAEGVFSSTAEANEAGLSTWRGDAYEAGDVHFRDMNGDKVIDDNDKQIIGCAAPDFFGGFNTYLRIRNFSLSAEFTYAVGNDAYNGVRRSIEAMDSFNNQSRAVVNRWKLEGQITDIPRAVYGDPLENNTFSTRWIEDASYVKLRSVTLSYNFDKKFLEFFRSGTIYVTGENLYTWTDYLGLDPEFSYSYSESMQGMDYSKVVLPRCVKFGFNLKF
jgi:TonB-linked SusC/RagA family outer membrane protein